MKTTVNNKNILTFPIVPPFDIAYRNGRILHPVGPHSHDAVEIYYTLSDLPDVLLNNTVSAVPAGTLIIIPPFCVHQLYHEVGKLQERYILSINLQWLNGVFCNREEYFSYLKERSKPLVITPSSSQKTQWQQLSDSLLTFSSFHTPEALSLFFRILALLNQMVDSLSPKETLQLPVSAGQKRTNDIICYIQTHIYENLTVADLATHFYLHPDYLSRLFKKHAHISVSQYITLQKITTAQSFLREGYTVTQVQEKLGYSSYAYFFKSFQKNTGLSPSKYREQYQISKTNDRSPK